LKKPIEIRSDETGRSLHDRLAKIAPKALLEALELLGRNQAPRIKQDNAAATIAPKLDREAGRTNWSEPAEVIERQIRAFNPWPGSFTPVRLSDGNLRTLKIFAAKTTQGKAKPGEIVSSKDELIVGTGTGALSLLDVQLEGKRRLSAAEFLRGQRGSVEIAAR